ncbi:unnamed protein product [Didymodactylos carnosus]|uniref:Uncharacterized protein n=1 Tax=Didymodactylos carnosus TaxID=1234261 RepID=A0A815RMQ1_9BILA|nr:unnamed protein product [Didymodactylos carnosus]CAF4344534.1 unnamed protein product [Didymodactylos carnosus]
MKNCSPVILAAYGTDSKFTAIDIFRRWIHIYEQCSAKQIRIIGFSTDCDSKYLRAMKLVSGFFADLSSLKLHEQPGAFEVAVPATWTWFYLRKQQLLLFFQDPAHLATKLRVLRSKTKTFPGIRLLETINPTLGDSYFDIKINDEHKFLHKQTACWLLTDKNTRLSSDRLTRVEMSKRD